MRSSGNGEQPPRRRQVAVAIGARHRDAGLPDGALQGLAEGAALRVAAFAEATREDRGAARPHLTGLRDGRGRGSARNQHHHMVGLLRQIAQRRIADLGFPHGLAARIDRIDPTRKAHALQRAPHAARPAAGPVARPHDRDIGGRQ